MGLGLRSGAETCPWGQRLRESEQLLYTLGWCLRAGLGVGPTLGLCLSQNKAGVFALGQSFRDRGWDLSCGRIRVVWGRN